ncbi:FadR/GntR family transcriptional regulator [Caenispirillum salinarum]|uniref:FadR/GntR family transcriptional regulator n=1 Tax=Caenispirillum salinarum TaxID=859058 RepID=UPI001267474B|nr:FCD domain-containing protein [Caenispirillum salinarum]
MSPAASHSTNASRDLGNRVAEELAAGLFSGRYRPGEMLPKETELCDAFGMSRPSVRNGLQILSSLGIVRRISGKGTVVEEFREWNLLDPMVTRWMAEYAQPNPNFLAEIFEFRHATEPTIAALAARKATARDLLAMEEAFQGMEAALEGAEAGEEWDRSAFSDHDVAFHAAIYRATHNLVWAQLAHILRPSITLVVRTSNETAEELRDSLGRHRHLMECIRLRRPEDAEEAARRVMARTAFDLGITPDPDAGPGPAPNAHAPDDAPKKASPHRRA